MTEEDRGRDRRRNPDKDERVKLPLEPEAALRALLAVDPREDEADEQQTSGEDR